MVLCIFVKKNSKKAKKNIFQKSYPLFPPLLTIFLLNSNQARILYGLSTDFIRTSLGLHSDKPV